MSDILVLGATGYTGQRIIKYLYNHPQRSSPGFTIAAAARSKSKLQALVRELELGDDVELGIIDITHEDELELAVRRSKVVINAVGPFWRWGKPVVASCARNGVHYVDITGEPHFVFDVVRRFDFLANKNDAIIIPACGVESILSDATVYLSNKTLKSTLGPDASIEDSLTVYHTKFSISRGTFATILSVFEDIPTNLIQTVNKHYALSFSIKGPPNPPTRLVYTIPYTSPTQYGLVWPLRAINRQIVQRTWSLFETARLSSPGKVALAYGDKFRYDECLAMPGFISACVFGIGLSLFTLALLIPPVRWLLKLMFPEDILQEGGYIKVVNISSSNRTNVRSVMEAGIDCYVASARMVSESALSLILDFEELPYREVGGGGVLTPMTGLGDVLIRRLRDYAQFTFESEVVLKDEEGRKDR